MKQQINPVMAAVIAIAAIAVLAIVIFAMNGRSSAPVQPTAAPTATETAGKNMSPDEQVKMRTRQMQQGGGTGQ